MRRLFQWSRGGGGLGIVGLSSRGPDGGRIGVANCRGMSLSVVVVVVGRGGRSGGSGVRSWVVVDETHRPHVTQALALSADQQSGHQPASHLQPIYLGENVYLWHLRSGYLCII